MSQINTQNFEDFESCVDAIIAKVGKNIVLGMPLGLGKPAQLANAIYQRAKSESDINLKIVTAISLEKPSGKSKLEKNFLDPFVERCFAGVPDLDYIMDLRSNKLPKNIQICEFFFKAGSFLNVPSQQQNYIYSNYTHAARDLILNGVNVVAQTIGKKEVNGKTMYSFSCNPDLSLDLEPMLHELERKGTPVAIIGEVNTKMPFMYNDAMFSDGIMDMVIDSPAHYCELFGVPNMAITPVDHMIGFNASTLVKDGGTLQLGIGSLGSAAVYSTLMRHEHNDAYNELYNELELEKKYPVIAEIGGTDTFTKGLYGCSEMMVDGFLYLHKAGILTRQVFGDIDIQNLLNEDKITTKVDLGTLDALIEREVINDKLGAKDVQYLKDAGIFNESVELKDGSLLIAGEAADVDLGDLAVRSLLERKGLGSELAGGITMHGGFFLGPSKLYQMLDEMTYEEHQKFCMTSVNYINHLMDHKLGRQDIKVAQRKEARFINSTMMATLGGAAISDGLADGRVVSGVGGQYNFVAMAHEIDDSRSILKLKSTRQSGGTAVSNIMINYGHITIPRHLRDIYVTEYGVADLLGKMDSEVYIEMIKIADSRFQGELLEQAKKVGKIPFDYKLPPEYCNNTPQRIQEIHKKYSSKGHFGPFPFGCDFTDEELKVGKALKGLKAKTTTKSDTLKCVLRALKIRKIPEEIMPLIKRMKLDNPTNFKEKLEQKLLASELMS